MRQPFCKHCKHPAHRADCGVDDCGCVRYEPRDLAAREARKRTFVVEVKFFVRNRWVESGVFKVKAFASAGAAATGIREAKREHLKPRTRVAQTIATIVPVRGGGR
jgi:hypothetical protein